MMLVRTASTRAKTNWLCRRASYIVSLLPIRQIHITQYMCRPHSIANIKQEPLFPGSYQFVTKFDGEYSYSYPIHTLAMIYDNRSTLIITCGIILSPVFAYYLHLTALTWPIITGYGLILYACARWCASGKRNKLKRDLRQREVIITGATSGIGKATAMQLAQMGANVTVVSRNGPHVVEAMKQIEACKLETKKNTCVGKVWNALTFSSSNNNNNSIISSSLENVEQEQVIKFEPLDLSNYIAVKEYVKRMRVRNKPIDLLINCAAMVSYTPITTTLHDDCQLAVNYLGPFLLTEGLLPLIIAAHGRVVYVSCATNLSIKSNLVNSYLSGNGIWTMQLRSRFNGIEQYDFTKLANIYHAQDLAIRAYPKNDKNNNSMCNNTNKIRSTRFKLSVSKQAKSNNNNKKNDNNNSSSSSSNSSKNDSLIVTTSELSTEPLFTVCACNPGLCISKLYHSLPYGNLFDTLRYVCLMFMRTSWEASQTVVNCCVRRELCNGGFYANVKYQPSRLPKLACERREREQVMS